MHKQICLCWLYCVIISFLSAVIGGIVLLLVQYFFCSNCKLEYVTNVGVVTSVLTTIATIVSAIFVCCTFEHQRKTYNEVQFKSAFYSMQNYHRKLTDNLKIKVTILNDDLSFKSKTYIARQSFLYAYKEVAKIIDVLSQEKYLGKLNGDDKQRILYWEMEGEKYPDETNERIKCDANAEQAILEYKRKYYIGLYKISEERYNESRGLSDKTIFAFQIFWCIWQICYEHYLRNLRQLLMYVYKETQPGSSRDFYLKSIVAQMAKEELWFIKQYSYIDSSFHKCYTDSGMDKVVEEQLTK